MAVLGLLARDSFCLCEAPRCFIRGVFVLGEIGAADQPAAKQIKVRAASGGFGTFCQQRSFLLSAANIAGSQGVLG